MDTKSANNDYLLAVVWWVILNWPDLFLVSTSNNLSAQGRPTATKLHASRLKQEEVKLQFAYTYNLLIVESFEKDSYLFKSYYIFS